MNECVESKVVKMRAVHYGFRGSQGIFCRYDSWVITDQLAIGAGALERELLADYYNRPQTP